VAAAIEAAKSTDLSTEVALEGWLKNHLASSESEEN